MTSCPEALDWDSCDFEKKNCKLRFGLRRSELIFKISARPVQIVDRGVRARALVGSVSWELTMDEQSALKNCVSLSSCRKSKLKEGNKSFVPEPRESSVFRVFRIPMRMNILWTYVHFTYTYHGYVIRSNNWKYLAVCIFSENME